MQYSQSTGRTASNPRSRDTARSGRAALVLLLALLVTSAASAATLTVEFTNHGRPLADPMQGRFYVYEPDEREKYVAWGHVGQSARFPDGEYDVVIRYVNDKVVSEKVRNKWNLSGAVKYSAEFSVDSAELTIFVTSDGRPVPTYAGRYELFRAGNRDQPLVKRRPGEPVVIRPGTYDVRIDYRDSTGLQTEWLTEFVVQGVVSQTVELGTPPASLRLEFVESGRPLRPRGTRWRVISGDRVVAEGRSGDRRSLPAGTYDIALEFDIGRGREQRLLEAVEIRGEMDQQVDLTATESASLNVRVHDRSLRLATARFTVHPPGQPSEVIARGRSGEAVPLDPGTYDVHVVFSDGGVRADRWVRNHVVEGRSRLDIDLDIRPATLRITAPRRMPRDSRSSNVMIVLDSSLDMASGNRARTRMDIARQAILDAAPILERGDVRVGLRAYGIAPRAQRDCRDSSLLLQLSDADRRDLRDTIELLRPSGLSPVALSLDRVRGDLPGDGRNHVVVIAGSGETCEGDPCSAAGRLLRDGRADRLYTLALRVDNATEGKLKCAGNFRHTDSRSELRAALREIFREAAGEPQGAVSVFAAGGDEWIAGGALGDTLQLSEGTYDVVIRAGDRLWEWSNFAVAGEITATASSSPPSR